MIRIDESEIRQLEKQRKRAGGYLIIASIIILTLGFFLYIAIEYAPAYWCEQWNGTLYTNNKCYIIADMSKCVDPEGYLKESSRSLVVPNINYNFTGGK